MIRTNTIILAAFVVFQAIATGRSQEQNDRPQQPVVHNLVLPFPDEFRKRGFPPYAELVLKLDGNALIRSKSKVSPRLRDVLAAESPKFDVLWWDQNDALVLQAKDQPFDLESLSLIGETPRIGTGIYRVQVRIYHPNVFSKEKAGSEGPAANRADARLIAEPLVSAPVEVLVASGYAITVTPATAEPGQPVEIALSAKPSHLSMSGATVSFGGTDAPVVERGNYTLRVDVPAKLTRGLRPEIRVTLHGADGGAVKSEPYQDFAISAAKDGSFLNWAIALIAAMTSLGVVGTIMFALNRRSLERERARWLEQVRVLDAKRESAAMRNSTLAAAVESLKEQLHAVMEPRPESDRAGEDGEDGEPTNGDLTRAAGSPHGARKSFVPDVPDELVAACRRGQCVLYAGRGVGAMGGLPTWREGLGRVVSLAAARFPEKKWHAVRNIYRNGDLASVTDLLCARISWEDLIALVRQVFDTSTLQWPEIYTVLGDFPFAGIYNGNWDSRIMEAVRHRDPVILTTSDFEEFEPLLRGDRFFLLNVDGDLDRPDTVVFSTEQYRKALTDNDWCSKFLSGCLAAKTVFFVGASPESIENFLSGLRLGPRRDDQPHKYFALVGIDDNFDAHSERFLLKYGITLLGYRATKGHPEVPQFLGKLRQLVGDSVVTRHPERTPRLDRVILRNVGLFESLDLDLQSAPQEATATAPIRQRGTSFWATTAAGSRRSFVPWRWASAVMTAKRASRPAGCFASGPRPVRSSSRSASGRS